MTRRQSSREREVELERERGKARERERESSRERERAREGERARCWTAISVGEVREGLGEDSLPDFVSSWT